MDSKSDGGVAPLNLDEAADRCRALANDKDVSPEDIRTGLADILRDIPPEVLARCGIV